MERTALFAGIILLVQLVLLVQGDGNNNEFIASVDTKMNLDDDDYTPSEITFLFKYVGLNATMAAKFTDILFHDGDTNGDGILQASEMKI